MQLSFMFINPELSDAERRVGALKLFYPTEGRMLYVSPLEILCMNALEVIFDLTPSEARLVREKAKRLQNELIDQERENL